MHSDKVKATAKSIGLVGGSPKPMTSSASKRDRDQRKKARKEQMRGKMTTAANEVYDKAKGTTKY